MLRKNILAAIPWAKPKDEDYRQGLYTLVEQTKTINEQKLRILTIFNPEQEPYCRIFRLANEFISEMADHKWSNAMLDKNFWLNHDYTKNTVCFKCFTNNELAKEWFFFQEDIRRGALEYKYTQRKIRTERFMALIHELPKGLESWIDKVPLLDSRYLYYKGKGSGIEGYCTHCKQQVFLPKRPAKGKLYGVKCKCPECGSTVTLRPAGLGNTAHDSSNLAILQKVPAGFCIRIFNVRRDFRPAGYKNPVEQNHEYSRIFLIDGKWHKYYWEDKYIAFLHKHVAGWYRLDELTRSSSWYSPYYEIGKQYLYTKNINSVLKNTPYQYSQLYDFAKHLSEPFSIDNYLEAYIKAPALEYLIKMKLYRLANYVIDKKGFSSGGLRLYEKGPEAILGVKKEYFSFLRRLDPNNSQLEIMQFMSDAGRHPSMEEVEFWAKHVNGKENLGFCLRYASSGKLIKYFTQQLEIAKKTKTRFYIHDWEDYVNAAELFGLDIKSEFILFPKNFKEAHDNTTAMIKADKDKLKSKAYKKRYEELMAVYSYKTKKYMIVAPKNSKDLVKEGQALHHCVGGYCDSHLKGRTTILFVRELEKPNKPFYTLEVGYNLNIIQCRGLRNTSYVDNKDVNNFIASFQAKKLDPLLSAKNMLADMREKENRKGA